MEHECRRAQHRALRYARQDNPARVSSFGTFAVADSVTGIGLHGVCAGTLFEVVYDPATDRMINVIWVNGEHTGVMTRH
jgi:hypothetical protein